MQTRKSRCRLHVAPTVAARARRDDARDPLNKAAISLVSQLPERRPLVACWRLHKKAAAANRAHAKQTDP